MQLIDLHCHLLPGVDDGPKTLAQALTLAKAAVKEGIGYSLLTPHHLNGVYDNPRQKVCLQTQLFQKALQQAQIPLTVFPGQEVHLSGALLTEIQQDKILFADNTGRYLLLELPYDAIPTYTWQMVDTLLAQQIRPVIVHPERNLGIQADPALLYQLVQAGCLSQLTAGSYVGVFGKKTQRLTRRFIEAGLGHCFASDAHQLNGRSFYMRQAFQKLQQHAPQCVTDYQQNALHIVNGDPVTIAPFKIVKKYQRFWLF
ncbi:tyrosine-protein phosphatase [Agrilactobacillus yilanensis]|uniref:Tyrosine-protein phosphatase n=1 Tax=Agrilactobacillus yilanensis TaxID=2485997 RepID=A0ABW4J6Q1_9LACO|nr:CpsB/CapC family capsule biosynthesis tyrosine phosphatase [Agrilactobacillus yilanensis]